MHSYGHNKDNDDAGFYIYKITEFIQMQGEHGARLQFYPLVEDGLEDEFCCDTTWPLETEKLVCLGEVKVKEVVEEGHDSEYIVIDTDAIKQALVQAATDQQRKQARSMLGMSGTFYGENRKRRKMSSSSSAPEAATQVVKGMQRNTSGSADKENQAPNPVNSRLASDENTHPNRGQVRGRGDVMQCAPTCRCFSCVQAILKRPRTLS